MSETPLNPEIESATPYFLYDISNVGRSPAIIEQCWIGIIPADFDPEEPIEEIRWNGPLGPEKSRADCIAHVPANVLRTRPGAFITLATGGIRDALEIPDGGSLFFFAIINYRDLRRDMHVTRICWRWEDEEGGWVRYGAGNARYDQTT